MMQEIHSKVIGQLKQNSLFSDCWESQEIEIPFFYNKKLILIFMNLDPETDALFINEADQALTHFLTLSAEDRNAISELAYKNCMDF